MRNLVLILSMLVTTTACAQIDQYLTDYSISEQNGAVLISWTTGAGFTCEDINITFGIDSNDQKVVYTYPGICGSDTTEEKYSYLFRDVVYNQPNYFQIDLGTYGTSPVLQITVISVDGLNPKVFPNPVSSESTVLFSNPNQEIAIIRVFNTSGVECVAQYTTRDNELLVSNFKLNVKGLYYFTIEVKGVLSRGKFLFL